MVWGCISVHSMGVLHICEGTIDAEAYVGILESHMLLRMYGASRRGESDNGNHRLLSSSSLVYSNNVQKFHLAKLQQFDIFISQTIKKCN